MENFPDYLYNKINSKTKLYFDGDQINKHSCEILGKVYEYNYQTIELIADNKISALDYIVDKIPNSDIVIWRKKPTIIPTIDNGLIKIHLRLALLALES